MKHFSCRTCQCLCYQMCINTFQDKNSLYLFDHRTHLLCCMLWDCSLERLHFGKNLLKIFLRLSPLLKILPFKAHRCMTLIYLPSFISSSYRELLLPSPLHPNILIHSSLHTFIPSLSLCQLGIVLLLYFWDRLSHLFPGSRSRSYFLCGAFSSSKLLQLIYCGILADFSSIKYMGRIKLLSLFFLAQRVSAYECADL